MIAAILQHILLLLTFRHKGTGLPSNGPVPYLLLFGAFVLSGIKGSIGGEGFISLFAAAIGIGIVVVASRSRPWLTAPVALVCIGGDALAIGVSLLGQPTLTPIGILWQVAAIVVFVRNFLSSNRM